MWTGDLSKKDHKVINIGYNGLKLPPIFEGKQTENICNQPIQKKLNNNYFIPELKKMTKHFILNWKIIIYYKPIGASPRWHFLGGRKGVF